MEKIDKLKTENEELKKMLKLAFDEITKQKLYADVGIMSRAALCKSCQTRDITNRVCQECKYKYEHADEILKLIGAW